jgi:hypothetical protein
MHAEGVKLPAPMSAMLLHVVNRRRALDKVIKYSRAVLFLQIQWCCLSREILFDIGIPVRRTNGRLSLILRITITLLGRLGAVPVIPKSLIPKPDASSVARRVSIALPIEIDYIEALILFKA